MTNLDLRPKAFYAGSVLLGLILMLGTCPAQMFASPGGNKPSADISVTTTVVDFDPLGNPYTIQSDGGGAYPNGVSGVISILTANTYNQVATGDWQFNKPYTVKGKTVQSGRKMAITFNVSDAVQPGDPHYTAPANPPFWGTQVLNAYAEVKCSLVFVSMMEIAANTATTCPMIFSFYTTDGVQYGFSPSLSFSHLLDTTDVQVSCNSADSAGCKDWFIEPIGSLQAVGRLGTGGVNHGDFYMRFKFHVTRP